ACLSPPLPPAPAPVLPLAPCFWHCLEACGLRCLGACSCLWFSLLSLILYCYHVSHPPLHASLCHRQLGTLPRLPCS
uniref:Uncharacterized protein n=1 Tax=Mus spicilegus TaxID=10103 RepID=A0A8C6H3Q6_MUSSI